MAKKRPESRNLDYQLELYQQALRLSPGNEEILRELKEVKRKLAAQEEDLDEDLDDAGVPVAPK